jgi:hypothetical protein
VRSVRLIIGQPLPEGVLRNLVRIFWPIGEAGDELHDEDEGEPRGDNAD